VEVLRPTQHKIGHFADIPKPIFWLGMEKLNLTQQKHTFTNQKKCTTTQIYDTKNKARFSHLWQEGHPARKKNTGGWWRWSR